LVEWLDWRYGCKQNGIYVDGHEWEDVVTYRMEFLARWNEYEKKMVTYNRNSNINSTPLSPGVTLHLTAWGLGLEGFGHWLQLMCCAHLLLRSEYFLQS